MPKEVDSLQPHTMLDRFELIKVLGGGGFSVVYLAKDTKTNDEVVIKEFFPAKLAKRAENKHIIPKDDDKCAKLFNMGRKLFFQEASILANFNHPNIVNIVGFFSANGTIYTAMGYEKGDSLYQYIKKTKGKMPEDQLMKIFLPVLSSLREVHQLGLLHLDIKPGNIFIREDLQPILLDFGAAHKLVRLAEPRTFPVVSHGFSPPEQSLKTGNLGPWTDVYAIGATMRTCITGKPPPAAKDRRRDPEMMKPATEEFKDGYSEKLLKAIDWAMEMVPTKRPQTVDEFAAALRR
ncbi:MAG: serine/threonine protein kinase [Gammaproteobacteria bacterium]|nr:serine/threonine protein kinase [Gammaproteobacteria bacterium]